MKLANQNKLADQSCTCDRNVKGNNNSYIWKQKIKLVVEVQKKKEEAKNVVVWLKQRHMKGEKHIVQINFAEYLRKWDVFRERQSFYGRFLKNGLHEMYYISKSRWEVQYLEKSGYWSRDDSGNEWPRF